MNEMLKVLFCISMIEITFQSVEWNEYIISMYVIDELINDTFNCLCFLSCF